MAQALLNLKSSTSKILSAICTSSSFTSPRKLGLVNLNMNLGLVETELLKFSPLLKCFTNNHWTFDFHIHKNVYHKETWSLYYYFTVSKIKYEYSSVLYINIHFLFFFIFYLTSKTSKWIYTVLGRKYKVCYVRAQYKCLILWSFPRQRKRSWKHSMFLLDRMKRRPPGHINCSSKKALCIMP